MEYDERKDARQWEKKHGKVVFTKNHKDHYPKWIYDKDYEGSHRK